MCTAAVAVISRTVYAFKRPFVPVVIFALPELKVSAVAAAAARAVKIHSIAGF